MGVGETGGRIKTGWGQSGEILPGSNQKVSMQCNLDAGPGAGNYTVQFNIINPGEVVNAEALISWRVEGQEVTRRISIADGTSVTGVGQAIRVTMYDATPPVFVSGTPKPYVVSVQVAPGVRASTTQPPYLIPFKAPPYVPFDVVTNPAPGGGFTFAVAAGGTVDIDIPNNAGVNQVYVTAISTGAIADGTSFAELTDGTTTLKIWDTQANMGWIPSVAGASVLTLSNGGLTPIRYSVTFGVEG